MKSVKKICCIVLAMLTLCWILPFSTFAAESEISFSVGESVEEFEYYYYFDGDKGIIDACFNKFMFNEAEIRVFHTTNSHYGVVIFGSRTSSTNNAPGGEWTRRTDVQVGEGRAIYKALY